MEKVLNLSNSNFKCVQQHVVTFSYVTLVFAVITSEHTGMHAMCHVLRP
jgi:hypothetical protein